MIVASFYAPRPEEEKKRWGCDYDSLLMATEASCRRWGLEHIVISDSERPEPLRTHLVDLPENLMQALIAGQEDVLKNYTRPVLFIGADCLIARDPREFAKLDVDLAITVGPFGDCRMNTGAIWCNETQKCLEVWRGAKSRNPLHWGEDQRAIYASVKAEAAIGLKVFELRCEDHNWAPENINDSAGLPTVVHFRGTRKDFMLAWAKKHLDLEPVK
jgi:hypothetical protein